MKKTIDALVLLFGVCIILLLTPSCENIGKNNLKGYEWLEGEWFANYTKEDYREDIEINYGYDLTRAEIERAVEEFQEPQVLRVIIDKKHIRYELPGETSNLKKKHDYQITGDFLCHIVVDGNELLDFANDSTVPLTYNNVTNKYESWVVLQKKINTDASFKEDKSTDEKEEVVSQTSRKKSTVNEKMEKEFKKAFKNNECIYFRTQYGSPSKRYLLTYLVLYPFVFSDDGLRGIMYEVQYGQKNDGTTEARIFYWGEYEVVGDYLRVFDIVDILDKQASIWPIILKIDQLDGNLQLKGKLIKAQEVSVSKQEQQPIPYPMVSLIERFCMHK